MYRVPLVTCLALIVATTARGDPPPGVKTIRVVLHPAAPPSPALRYPLLPELRDQKPGNAVPAYRKAVVSVKAAIAALDDKKWYERVDHWREMPVDQLPREQVRAFLRPFEEPLRIVAEAVRHEYSDWELTDKLRTMGIAILLPDIQEARQFATFLSLRFRLALAEGRFDDAVRDVQTMFALARHVGQSPTLISSLVGMAISGIAAAQAEELIQRPGMPNLYWSLTDLPQPFIDLRIAFQSERLMAYGTFPGLPMSPRDEVKPLTPEQAAAYAKLLVGLREENRQIPDAAYKVIIGLDIQRKYEKSKQALIDTGWSRTVVEKMPHLEVAVLEGFIEFNRRMDDAIKWNGFPYWQAEPALMELEKRRAKLNFLPSLDEPAYPIADIFLSGNGRIMYSRTRLERRIAALRCLEAIRFYAASHDGKLPTSLAAIQEVPVPVDPFSGQPFEYSADADKATLYAAARARPGRVQQPNPQDALHYEIVLKR